MESTKGLHERAFREASAICSKLYGELLRRGIDLHPNDRRAVEQIVAGAVVAKTIEEERVHEIL